LYVSCINYWKNTLTYYITNKQKTSKEISKWIRKHTDQEHDKWLFAVLNSKNHTSELKLERAANHLFNLLDIAAFGRNKHGNPKSRLSRVCCLESNPENPHIHLIIKSGGKIHSTDLLISIIQSKWVYKPGPFACCGKHGRLELYNPSRGGVEYLSEKFSIQTLSHQATNQYRNIEGFTYEDQ